MASNRLRIRRNTASAWTSINPTLSQGEPGIEIDTGWFKIGDGIQTWSELSYFAPQVSADGSSELTVHINNAEDPHPNYDDGRSFFLLYENAKV